MAGLLDAIFPSSDGGGLLDFLKRNAMNQQPLQNGAPGDTAQYGGAPQPAPVTSPSAGITRLMLSARVTAGGCETRITATV